MNEVKLLPAEVNLLLESDDINDDTSISENQKIVYVIESSFSATPDNSSAAFTGTEIIATVRKLLNIFIQENFTGPPLREVEIPKVSKLDGIGKAEQAVLDGEVLIENVRQIGLLMGAEHILMSPEPQDEPYQSIHWWKIRTYFLHQSCLEEKSMVLWNRIQEEITKFEPFSTPGILGPELATMFYAELSGIYSYYYDFETAKRYLTRAKEVIGLRADTTGILGKRTKFQQTSLPQLVLSVELDDRRPKNEDLIDCVNKFFPTSVILEDEDRLDRIQLSDNTSCILTGAHLSPLQHLVLSSDFCLRRKYLPSDGVYAEDLLAYLSFLIYNPKVWAIQMSSLLQRSLLEVNNRRTVERSMKQLEVLRKAVEEPTPAVSERIKYFYGSGMPMKWEIEASLSQVLASLHLFKEALNISVKLNRWENVITCYNSLNLRHKAEEVIREQLAVRPTVKLWILLGDATDNIEYYETAWKLSNERSARAQRQWGYYHFVRKQYAEAIPHLQTSLQLNPLENPAWIRLGYSALVTENWAMCTKAYQHSSLLDSDNFEIWNNLANGFIKLGEKKKGLRALKEASKCNYESWKVWDNTLVVATDCKAFDEAIRAYNRLLDLKGKWVDEQVLELLVKAVLTNMKDARDLPSRDAYYKSALKLFGRISSTVTSNPKVWKLYSDLLLVEDDGNLSASDSILSWSKSVNYSQKAVECILAESNWVKTEAKVVQAVAFTVEYIKRLQDFQAKYPEGASEAVTKGTFTVRRVYNSIKKARDTAIVQGGFDQHLTEIISTAELLKIEF